MNLDLDLDCTKIAWHPDRIAQWLRKEPFAPITIDLALTRACDYNCIYCYSKFQENRCHPITFPVIKAFLKDAADMGVKGISLVSDGESTLSDSYVPTIQLGHKLGLSMASGTHGLHLTKKKLQFILPCLEYLRFNISAGESKEYSEIMGTAEKNFYKVIENVKHAVEIKKHLKLKVILGMQMVLMPNFGEQIIPLTNLAIKLGVDYLVIKHCSDNKRGELGIDYLKYQSLYSILKMAEAQSTSKTQIIIKWSKIKAGKFRSYMKCYGAQFLLQISGSGLVAPCGCLFGEEYKAFHIGNIATQRLKDIIFGSRYRKIMGFLASSKFNAQTMCGYLCVQHKTCEALDNFKKKRQKLNYPKGEPPMHVNFI